MNEIIYDKIPEKANKAFYLEQFNKFRGIMCSGYYSIEQKTEAFDYFSSVYVSANDITQEERHSIIDSFTALCTEWEIRRGLELKERMSREEEE